VGISSEATHVTLPFTSTWVQAQLRGWRLEANPSVCKFCTKQDSDDCPFKGGAPVGGSCTAFVFKAANAEQAAQLFENDIDTCEEVSVRPPLLTCQR